MRVKTQTTLGDIVASMWLRRFNVQRQGSLVFDSFLINQYSFQSLIL